jgi:intracellular sulfur oxidation DsrE/DsrF family protein
MKKLLQRFTIIIILITVQFVSKAQNATTMHKVVIQLNTADTAAWSGTIGNIKNLQKIWPGAIQVEVVAHGKGLDLLVKAKTHLATEVEALSKEGVIFSACENSMKKHNVTKADLLLVAGTVPSGVAELVLKQEQGWSYLKASVN